jgi:4'-phosphopantetheinyl transferase EntD
VIDDLLPTGVAAAEAFDDPTDVVLFPEEEEVVSQAVDKRRREFTTARQCARAALAELGIPPAPILPGPRNEPRWPSGVAGSITHCAGYRAAAVARTGVIASIGIDAEPNAPLPAGVLDEVSLPEERTWIEALREYDRTVHWDRLLFSAKESVYKAWYPLTRLWLDFDEAVLSVDPFLGRFTARLLVPGPSLSGGQLTTFTGRWLVRDGLVVTATVTPADARPERSGPESARVAQLRARVRRRQHVSGPVPAEAPPG